MYTRPSIADGASQLQRAESIPLESTSGVPCRHTIAEVAQFQVLHGAMWPPFDIAAAQMTTKLITRVSTYTDVGEEGIDGERDPTRCDGGEPGT